MTMDMETVRRAWGCMLGLIAGDALGSQVAYVPAGHMAGLPGECFTRLIGARAGSLPGQPSACSEMALALARTLAACGRFEGETVFAAYKDWLATHPRDFDHAVFRALKGKPTAKDVSSSALARTAVLGIRGAGSADTPGAARLDAEAMAEAGLTHPNPLCGMAAAVYASGIAHAIAEGTADASFAGACAALKRIEKQGITSDEAASALELIRTALDEAEAGSIAPAGASTSSAAAALQNAFAMLRTFTDPAQAVASVARLGGNTSADCALTGALLGSVHGIDAFPDSWTDAVLACVPMEGRPGVTYPRPAAYHPTDFMQLAEALLRLGAAERT